jgi:hypothetical protein
MPIRNNGYYGDQSIGQAIGSLGQLFAPPSGSDLAGYATAKQKNAEHERLSKAFDIMTDPTTPRDVRDAYGTAAGMYAPTQSYYAVDTVDKTKRYDVDQTQATSRLNNTRDNQTKAFTTRYGALGEGQTLPAMPSGVAQMFGLPESGPVAGAVKLAPGQQATMPGGEVLKGAPQAVGASDMLGYRTADGRQGTAVYRPELGGLVDTQTNKPLPPDTATFKASVQGASVDALGKPMRNDVERQMLITATANSTATQLRDLIAKSPSSQGLVGSLRGTVQDAIQTGGELGAYFGADPTRIDSIKQMIAENTADQSVLQAFDPSIPMIEGLANRLVLDYAQAIMPGERLSNERVKQLKRSLGLDGLLANQARSLASLDRVMRDLAEHDSRLRSVYSGGVDSLPALQAPAQPSTPAASGAAPAAATAPAATGVERWERDPQTGKLRRVQ